jgi:hypothetical protein
MKLSKVQLAVSAAIALAAGNASALPLSTITGSEVKLYVSGATATDGAFANLTRVKESLGGICVDGSLDSYEYSAATPGTVNQRLNYCTGSANAGAAAGLRIMIAKESVSGSAAGVTPVAREQARDFLPFTLADLGACEAVASTVVAAGDFASYTYHRCDSGQVAALASVIPNAGISDIDPTTFVGLGGVTAADATDLAATSTVAVAFNPIVSIPLYRALQTAQGLANDDTLANVPSMTLSQLRGIFSGSLTDGTQLWSRTPSGSSAQVATSSKVIRVCRRGNTSGTMTSFKILFLGEGCSKNSGSIGSFVKPAVVFTGAVEDPETGDIILSGEINPETSGVSWSTSVTIYNDAGALITNGYGGVRVFAGGGSGDVRSCIGFHSAANGATTISQSLGNFAVGTASTENRPAAITTNASLATYRYIRVDGVEPTLKATMEGRYPYFTENTINRAQTGSNTISGNELALYGAVVAGLGKSTVLLNINSSWTDALQRSGGALSGQADTGILDIATASNHLLATDLPISDSLPRTKPINGQTRNYTLTPNNCNMSKQLFP